MTKKIHFIGIGGSGLSAIARVVLEKGYIVSGSDLNETPLIDELRSLGIEVAVGHSAKNIQNVDLIVRSSAIPDTNPEIKAAIEKGIPVLKRSDFLAELMEQQTCLAFAGAHGKTTTTAMLAWILVNLRKDPSYIIGGVSKNLGTNAHAGNENLFVIEADEYDFMFLGLQPDFAIVTNMEMDHPDCFPSLEDYYTAFGKFVGQLKSGGKLFVCKDRPETLQLIDLLPTNCSAFTYSLEGSADYYAADLLLKEDGAYRFTANYQVNGGLSSQIAEVELVIAGKHNAGNALAALSVIHQMGLSVPQAAKALSEFQGTERRFDIKGELQGITVIDDYAHHPTQIQNTLKTARNRYPSQRIWAVWQPHTYTRTQTLFKEFCESFENADQVIVTDIYAAREKNPGFSSKRLVEKMSPAKTHYIGSLSETTRFLKQNLKTGDVVLVLSAGDANTVSRELWSFLQKKEENL